MRRNFDWRWFPVCLIAAMAIVFAINGYMVFTAVTSFPGDAGKDGFDLSNSYGRVLTAAADQSALGWQVGANLDAARHPMLRLAEADGSALPHPAIEVQAERPVGPAETTMLTFRPLPGGVYVADVSLETGQWDLLVTVHAGGKQFTTTKRLVVP